VIANNGHPQPLATLTAVQEWLSGGMVKTLPEFLEQTKPEKVIERKYDNEKQRRCNCLSPEKEVL